MPNYLTTGAFLFDMDHTHSFITTKYRVTKLLRDAGFSVLDVRYVIGRFWVTTGFPQHLLRHLINSVMILLHLGIVTWIFEYLRKGDFLWKIRKSFFESLIILAIKNGQTN